MISRELGVKPPPRGEDLPTGDGEPMETHRHAQQMFLLISTLEEAWKDRDDFFVGGDMFIYFSELQAKNQDFRGPDVFVVLDTARRERKSWVVWEEEGRSPDVVIELTSASTEHVDRGEKMRIYAQLLHVAEYYIFDPFSGALDAYELEPSSRSYRKRTPDAEGRYASGATGLALGVVPTHFGSIDAPLLRWIGPDGAPLPTGAELAAEATERATQVEGRIAQAEGRAAQAEDRVAQAEGLVVQAQDLVAQAEERAAREATRAEEALRRVAELEARLRDQ